MILSLLKGMIKLYQHAQSNKFAISLQNLKKELRNGSYFLHADKQQRFNKLGLLFLIEVVRCVQSIFAICKEKSVATVFVFYSYAKHSNILFGSSYVRCYLFPCTAKL